MITHLGRYFKYKLKISADEAEKEIKTWLKRHFADQCNDYNGLIPFEGADKIIKSPYAICEIETLLNCMPGFKEGKPFKRAFVEIFYGISVNYIHSLEYPRRKEAALLALLNKAVEFGSLSLGFGYVELLELFRVGSRSTVCSWLREFHEDEIFVRTVKGFFNANEPSKGRTSKYHLMLPDNCYRVIDLDDVEND